MRALRSRRSVPSQARRIIDAVAALLVLVIAAYVAFHAVELGLITTGQTTGSGLPLELTSTRWPGRDLQGAVRARPSYPRCARYHRAVAIVGALLVAWFPGTRSRPTPCPMPAR